MPSKIADNATATIMTKTPIIRCILFFPGPKETLGENGDQKVELFHWFCSTNSNSKGTIAGPSEKEKALSLVEFCMFGLV